MSEESPSYIPSPDEFFVWIEYRRAIKEAGFYNEDQHIENSNARVTPALIIVAGPVDPKTRWEIYANFTPEQFARLKLKRERRNLGDYIDDLFPELIQNSRVQDSQTASSKQIEGFSNKLTRNRLISWIPSNPSLCQPSDNYDAIGDDTDWGKGTIDYTPSDQLWADPMDY